MKIMAVGEIIFDVFGNEAEIGGAPLNFCAHCSILGAKSALVSAVGNDSLGERATVYLSSFGVDVSFVQKNSSPTGMCIVTLDNGSPSYEIKTDAAYFNTSVTAETVEKIKQFNPDVFSFRTLIQRDLRLRKEIIRAVDECSFKEIFCDVNLRAGCYDKESCQNCLERATILKISSEEEPLLREFALYDAGGCERETVLNICESFPNIRIVLFTKGENGSLVFSKKENEFYDIPCVEAEVVSTVGAGDSYSAAFLCEYFRSGDCEKSGIAGANLSAYVVAHREAVPDII
jgi:fructokinase